MGAGNKARTPRVSVLDQQLRQQTLQAPSTVTGPEPAGLGVDTGTNVAEDIEQQGSAPEDVVAEIAAPGAKYDSLAEASGITAEADGEYKARSRERWDRRSRQQRVMADKLKDPKAAGILATAALATGVSTLVQAGAAAMQTLRKAGQSAQQRMDTESSSTAFSSSSDPPAQTPVASHATGQEAVQPQPVPGTALPPTQLTSQEASAPPRRTPQQLEVKPSQAAVRQRSQVDSLGSSSHITSSIDNLKTWKDDLVQTTRQSTKEGHQSAEQMKDNLGQWAANLGQAYKSSMDEAQASAKELHRQASKGFAATVSSISAGAAEAAELSDDKPLPRVRSEALWQESDDIENPLSPSPEKRQQLGEAEPLREQVRKKNAERPAIKLPRKQEQGQEKNANDSGSGFQQLITWAGTGGFAAADEGDLNTTTDSEQTSSTTVEATTAGNDNSPVKSGAASGQTDATQLPQEGQKNERQSPPQQSHSTSPGKTGFISSRGAGRALYATFGSRTSSEASASTGTGRQDDDYSTDQSPRQDSTTGGRSGFISSRGAGRALYATFGSRTPSEANASTDTGRQDDDYSTDQSPRQDSTTGGRSGSVSTHGKGRSLKVTFSRRTADKTGAPGGSRQRSSTRGQTATTQQSSSGNGPEGNFAERIAQFRKQSGTLSDTTAASVSPTSNNDTAYSTATVDMADVAPDADLRSKEGINPAGTVDMADVAPDADLRTKLYINPAGTVDMADVAPNADLRNKGTDRANSDSDRSAVKSAASQGRDKAPEPAKGDDKTEAQPAPVRRFSNATADQRTGERKRLAAERKRVANERDAAQRAAVLQRHVSYQEAQKRKADAKGQGRLQQQNKEAKLTQQAAQHVQSKRAPGGDTDDETVAASEVEAGDPASDVNEAAQQSRLGAMPSSDAANEGGANIKDLTAKDPLSGGLPSSYNRQRVEPKERKAAPPKPKTQRQQPASEKPKPKPGQEDSIAFSWVAAAAAVREDTSLAGQRFTGQSGIRPIDPPSKADKAQEAARPKTYGASIGTGFGVSVYDAKSSRRSAPPSMSGFGGGVRESSGLPSGLGLSNNGGNSGNQGGGGGTGGGGGSGGGGNSGSGGGKDGDGDGGLPKHMLGLAVAFALGCAAAAALYRRTGGEVSEMYGYTATSIYVIAVAAAAALLRAPGAAGAAGAIVTWLYLQKTTPPVDDSPPDHTPKGPVKSDMSPLSGSVAAL